MLHELLLALSGHEGIIFGAMRQQDADIKVNPALPLFHPAEVSVLNQLLSVATDYKKIVNFISKYGSAQSGKKKDDARGLLRGLYVEALCDGLELALDSYRAAIVHLERQILDRGDIHLSSIQLAIMPFQPLLAALNSLINQLNFRKAHGCYILDVVYTASFSGIDKVREAMNSILHEGHKVLYKQILAWILQGNLQDPYDEFFISPEASSSSREDSTLAESTSSQLLTLADDRSQTQFRSRTRRFRLRADRVPRHVSIKTAEKILFIGESVQLFEADRKLEAHGTVMKDREHDCVQQLVLLRDCRDFRSAEFERFVDSACSSTSRYLRDLVLERADLRLELATVRNFFLVARGELFHRFIEQVDGYLRKPASAVMLTDVNRAFSSACQIILPDDEAISRKVRFVLTSTPAAQSTAALSSSTLSATSTSSSGGPAWNSLRLEYCVAWPLHLVLSERALGDYNRIFHFLITVKRTQMALHRAWADSILRKKQRTTNDTANSYSSQLRRHMMFVVDNLQQYFMADVLESRFAVLMKKLQTAEDFEELLGAHDLFLAEILTLTFVNNKPVYHCLTDLLSTCLLFCELQEAVDDTNEEGEEEELGQLGEVFGRQSGLLVQLLSSLRSQHTGVHLAQLLLRIDFNRYYSRHGHRIGQVIVG